MQNSHDNPELVLAFKYVSETNTNIFLTGKAGTGKTTFLKNVVKHVNKRKVVVAPTGVAAINAGGVTIHSLFQLPFGPILPDTIRNNQSQRKMSRQKLNLIKSLDLLIIDEISMVRSDVLDGIDATLRRYRNPNKAFGGVQVLMIGDLHQLSPVAGESEWNLLKQYYSSPYFFGSKAFQQSNNVSIQLKRIYRQQDDHFISILNKVRENKMDEEVLKQLNARFRPQAELDKLDGYITLTAHNNSANAINQDALSKLKEKTFSYKAKVSGDFPEHSYPTEFELKLKKGAQVMFVKNDPSIEKQFFNGKIGTVVDLDDKSVQVRSDGELIRVEAAVWENRKYKLNESDNTIEESVKGSFAQIPLRLAWAITIHKSQGLTFDKLIIDARASFAHGQVYVALSRCTSLEGIVLKSKIESRSVVSDTNVNAFTHQAESSQPNLSDLEKAKRNYQISIIQELFEGQEIRRFDYELRRQHQLFDSVLLGDSYGKLNDFSSELSEKYLMILDKFKPSLIKLIGVDLLPEENAELVDRLKAAGNYFVDELEKLIDSLRNIHFLTDNSTAEKKMLGLQEDLLQKLDVMYAAFTVLKKSFNVSDYLEATGVAGLEKVKSKRKKSTPKTSVEVDTSDHPELFQKLRSWRSDVAADAGLPAYRIVSTKCLIECSNALPTTADTLSGINGIGKQKLNQFGDEILEIIEEYCLEKGISETDKLAELSKAPTSIKKAKKNKPDTKSISLQLFQEGHSVKEIAEKRDLAESTIEGHLCHYVGEGDIDVKLLVNEEDLETLTPYFMKDPFIALKELPEGTIDTYGYQLLRFVRAHVISLKAQEV